MIAGASAWASLLGPLAAAVLVTWALRRARLSLLRSDAESAVPGSQRQRTPLDLVTFALLGAVLVAGNAGPAATVALAFLLLAAQTDLLTRLVPADLLELGAGLALALAIPSGELARSLPAALLLLAVSLVAFKLAPAYARWRGIEVSADDPAFGDGDIPLFVLFGLALGFDRLFLGMGALFVLGLIAAVLMLGRGGLHGKIALGPLLAVAAALALIPAF